MNIYLSEYNEYYRKLKNWIWRIFKNLFKNIFFTSYVIKNKLIMRNLKFKSCVRTFL